jgi:hypothetical protein
MLGETYAPARRASSPKRPLVSVRRVKIRAA